MEIRSAVWQRLFTCLVFGFIGFLGLAAMLKAFLPRQIKVLGDNGESPAFLFWSGFAVTLFCLYWWWRTEKYCLRADEEGITQETGFGTTRVRWQDVAWYRLEPLRGTKERRIEPVLYESGGRVLLRPLAPTVVGTSQMDEERAQFWQFVESHLQGKRKVV